MICFGLDVQGHTIPRWSDYKPTREELAWGLPHSPNEELFQASSASLDCCQKGGLQLPAGPSPSCLVSDHYTGLCSAWQLLPSLLCGFPEITVLKSDKILNTVWNSSLQLYRNLGKDTVVHCNSIGIFLNYACAIFVHTHMYGAQKSMSDVFIQCQGFGHMPPYFCVAALNSHLQVCAAGTLAAD